MTATASEPRRLVVTDDTTLAEIVEALGHANWTAKRIPRHYVEHKKAAHAYIDYLLFEWQMHR
jgi:Uri superfamily endonuclease